MGRRLPLGYGAFYFAASDGDGGEEEWCENEIVILTATSGDTGRNAMAGFADAGTKIIVFFIRRTAFRIFRKNRW